ncbi:MAG: PulJ/GspJ family protein, partial [Candidatus Xenobia bacterium]
MTSNISISRIRRTAFTIVELLVAATLSILLLGMMFAFLIPTMRASVRGSSRVEMQQQAVVALSRMAEDLEATAAAGIALYVDPANYNPPAVVPAQGPNWTPMLMSEAPAAGGPGVIMSVVKLNNVNAQGQQVWDTSAIVYNWDKITDPSDTRFPGVLYRQVWDGKTPPVAAGEPTPDINKPVRLGDQTLLEIDKQHVPNTPTEPLQVLATGVNYFSAAGGESTLYPPQFPPPIVVAGPITLTLSLQRRTSKGG